MKRKLFVCALIVICFSIVAYSTIAYFSHEDTATNVITAGNVKIDLQEWSIAEDTGERMPFKDVLNVMPGTELSKIVEIKNTGEQSAFVRISLEKSIRFAEEVEAEADISLMGYDINKEYWTEKDGYYYYNTILLPGETTEPLFTKVIFADSMGNLYQNSTATIRVNAQATQAAHNGVTVLEADGWSKAE